MTSLISILLRITFRNTLRTQNRHLSNVLKKKEFSIKEVIETKELRIKNSKESIN